MSKCNRCAADRNNCINCLDNPIYNNIPKKTQFRYYQNACPFGAEDCKYDPARIAAWYPDVYDAMFGDLTPIEVAEKCCKKNKTPCAEYEFDDEYALF